MGYRSEIYIKVSIEDEPELLTLLTKHELDECFEKQLEDEDYVGYYASHLKWYDRYPDVKAINDFMYTDDETDDIRGMIVLGEDGATEEYGQPWEIDMHVVSRVEW